MNDFIKLIEWYLWKPIWTYKRINSWRDFDIFITEGLVFRFPKNNQNYINFLKEKRKLDIIKPYISLEIPSYIHIDDQMIIYPLIEWDTMKFFAPNHISEIIKFIKELHSIPIERFDSLNSLDTWDDNTISFVIYLKKEIEERLSKKDISSQTISNIHNYINELFFQFKSKKTVFVHGDLQPKNIIVNQDNIHGIIDFSDSRIGSPELDFCNMIYNKKLINKAIETYIWHYDKEFYERVFFLARRDVIFQITNDNLYNNNFKDIYKNLILFKFL